MGQKVCQIVDGGRRQLHVFHRQHAAEFPLDHHPQPTFLALVEDSRVKEEVRLELGLGKRQEAQIPLDEGTGERADR